MTREQKDSIIEDFKKHVAHSARCNRVTQDKVVTVITTYLYDRAEFGE